MMPTIEQCVVVLGPTEGWKGNCYAMAYQLVKAGLVKGTPVYGHWTGLIAPNSHFSYCKAPFVRHGWILMPDRRVCDPTRWVFEAMEPYLYVGPPDHYDEGGDGFRRAMYDARPAPAAEGPTQPVTVTPVVEVWLRHRFRIQGPKTRLADNQLFHLANLPYSALMEALGPKGVLSVYEMIAKRADTSIVWIPIDNAERARRECGFNPDTYYEGRP